MPASALSYAHASSLVRMHLHSRTSTGSPPLSPPARTNPKSLWPCWRLLVLRYVPGLPESSLSRPVLTPLVHKLHASVIEWRSGSHKPAPFSGDSYIDSYNEHVVLLQAIQQKNPRAYHVLMHRLYRQAKYVPVSVYAL